MKKLSITLLMLVVAVALSAGVVRERRIVFAEVWFWDNMVRSLPSVPIDAIVADNNCIKIDFIDDESQSATFEVKDSKGNIIYHDKTITNPQTSYQINLENLESGQYELVYSDEKIKTTGKFYLD
jgi:hypothetical protein